MNVLEALQNNGFATIDYIVVAIYIVILIGMGLLLSRGKKGEDKSSSDYFLAGIYQHLIGRIFFGSRNNA